MITRIRDVRAAQGLTLADVAARCRPPTTPQTIGRLETGTRTVSVAWLNRIAAALGVEAADLVTLPDAAELPVAAIVGAKGVAAPRRQRSVVPPRAPAGGIALLVDVGQGDYRAGDVVWLERVAPEGFAAALNRDALVPMPAGRFLFGRVLAVADQALDLLPVGGGPARRVAMPAWLGLAVRLVRELG